MGLSYKDVKRIKEEFEREYFFAQPYSEYVNMCGIGKAGITGQRAPIDSPGDWCIRVGLRKSLPPNLSIPTEYQEVKVITEVTGEIRIQ